MGEQDENLIGHLEALRSCLIKSLVALAIGFIPMFFAAPYAIDVLIKVILAENEISFNFFSPMEVFLIQIKMASVLDVIICFPYIIKQIWIFIKPALYENERYLLKSLVIISSLLFILGAAFCVCFILPLIINFGLSFTTNNINAMFGIANIVNLSLMLAVVFGAMFQFPLVTYYLIRTGIISYEAVRQKRPYIFVVILIIAGILTPPDIVSQLMLTVPTYLLFEAGLLAARKGDK